MSREDVPVGVVLPHEPDAPVAEVAHACTVSHNTHEAADWRFSEPRGESWVRTVEEHDGPGVGGLEELGVRGRPDGVLRPSPASRRRRHLQPRPPPSSRGLWRLLPQEAVPSVERQGGRRVVPGALTGGCHRRRLGCVALSLRRIYQTLRQQRRVVFATTRAWCTCFDVARPRLQAAQKLFF